MPCSFFIYLKVEVLAFWTLSKFYFLKHFWKTLKTHLIWFIHCAGFGWAIFNLEIHVHSGKICWIDFWKFLPLNFFHLIFLKIFLFGFWSHGYIFLILSFLYCFPLRGWGVLLSLVFSYLYGKSFKFILQTFFCIFHFYDHIVLSKGSPVPSKRSFFHSPVLFSSWKTSSQISLRLSMIAVLKNLLWADFFFVPFVLVLFLVW